MLQRVAITLTDDRKMITEDNPKTVNPGDSVIWSFEGNAAGQGLHVVLRNPPLPFNGPLSQFEGQSGQPDEVHGEEVSQIRDTFKYDVFDKDDTMLQWDSGVETGTIVIVDPPTNPLIG